MNNPWDPIDQPTREFNALRVDSSHPLDLFWALNETGSYMFVYEFQSANLLTTSQLPKVAGLDIESRKIDEESKLIVLILKDKQNWELFYSLCSDLVQATRESSGHESAVATFIRRLNRWQEFLKRGRPDLLVEERIKGLLGELVFLRDHLMKAFSAEFAVDCWKGPEGFPQDFNVNQIAIEVKCQSGGSIPSVRINSADQLVSQLPQLFLHVVTLARSDAAQISVINLPLVVEDLRTSIGFASSAALERFNDLLLAVGYTDSTEYLDFNYVMVSEDSFQVREAFPRIQAHELMPGVERVSYTIRLSACRPFEAWPKLGGTTV
jgi:hypothetical protein